MMALWAVSMAWASQWCELPALPALAPRSRAVVLGTVEAAETLEASWGLSTRYEIRVTSTLSGEAQELAVLELPGGRKDGLVQRFSGVPLWAEGDTVLVFLPHEGQRPLLAGLFTVVPDPVTGERLLDPLGSRPAALRPQTVEDVRALVP